MNIVGKKYPVTNATVTVKEFVNEKTGELVQYFEVVGEVAGCRKTFKANAEKDFFLDFLAKYGKTLDAPEVK